jgi:MFS family permease
MSLPAPMPAQAQTQAGAAPIPHLDARARRAVFFGVFPSIMLPMFMSSLDQTIVATALPAIAAQLGQVERVSWIVVAYLVAGTIAAPVYGRLGDALGRKRMLFVALSVSMTGSLLCALSGSMLMIVAGRVVQGLGGGGLMTMAQSLIGERIPARERGRYQGYLAATFVCSSTIGPVVGGYLTQHIGWQAVFGVTVIAGCLALALACRLPASPGAAGGRRLQFDIWGTVFFAAFVTPILLVLYQLQRFSLGRVWTIALLLGLAGLALVLFLRQERRASAPLLPLGVLAQPGIWRTCAMAAAIGGALISMISFLPMYLQVVRGVSPAEVGFIMLPMTVGVGFGAMITGRLISLTGRTTIFPCCGLPVTALGYAMLAIYAPVIPTGYLPWIFALVSVFTGSGMPVVQMTVQSVAGPRFLGSAAAAVQISRQMGAAFGTALVGAVLFAMLAFQDADLAGRFAELVQRGPAILASLDEARRAQVQREIADAFAGGYFTMCAFTLVALGMAWWIPVKRI